MTCPRLEVTPANALEQSLVVFVEIDQLEIGTSGRERVEKGEARGLAYRAALHQHKALLRHVARGTVEVRHLNPEMMDALAPLAQELGDCVLAREWLHQLDLHHACIAEGDVLVTLGWLSAIGILFEGNILDDEEPGPAQRLIEETLTPLDIVHDIPHLNHSLAKRKPRITS